MCCVLLCVMFYCVLCFIVCCVLLCVACYVPLQPVSDHKGDEFGRLLCLVGLDVMEVVLEHPPVPL